MNLYLISQTENNGWDTFDSAVVAAETEQETAEIHPESAYGNTFADGWKSSYAGAWCPRPDQVKVELLGTAKDGTEAGMVLASFNAG